MIDRTKPSFVLYPVNNNRTSWEPILLPMILVVTHKRTTSGLQVQDADALSVRIVIEDVQQTTPVAGHDHVGLIFPDRELYAINVPSMELANSHIEPKSRDFYKPDGTSITYEEAVDGDFFEYTTASGVTSKLEYIPTADYYDLSSFQISTEELESRWYSLSYNAQYYQRVVATTADQELLCINTNIIATAIYRFKFNHPGDIIDEMHRYTPGVYLKNVNKSQDETLQLYRPFADAIQDIFDEQWFIEQANWVKNINPNYVSYLAYLLGFDFPDVPYFPYSLDRLRKTVLQNIVKLQQLKGSKRCLIELFNIVGYNLLLSNMWWSSDGKMLIQPGQSLPAAYKSEEINIEEKCQVEPLLSEYNTSGFGQLTIPLLFRPEHGLSSDGQYTSKYATIPEIIVSSYLVEVGSQAHTELIAIVDGMNTNPNNYECGFTISGTGVVGSSEVVLDNGTNTLTGFTGTPPINEGGLAYNKINNTIDCTFNGSIIFNKSENMGGPIDLVLYSFATYTRINLIVPEVIQKLNSNRFTVEILNRNWEQVDSGTLSFIVDFIFKLKAFHSILYVLKYTIDLQDTYQVTDFCVGGNVKQRYDVDAGKLHTPPAIIPGIDIDSCTLDPLAIGYKIEDIQLRDRILSDLEAEFQATKELDGRVPGSTDIDNQPIGETCQYNTHGQNKSLADIGSTVENTLTDSPNQYANSLNGGVLSNTKLNQNRTGDTNTSVIKDVSKDINSVDPTYCNNDGRDYCYKGRAKDSILISQSIVGHESYRSKVCHSMGSGVYYTFPVPNQLLKSEGTFFSGGNVKNVGFDLGKSALSPANNNFLSRLMRAYDTPVDESLHFSDRMTFTADMIDQNQMLALQRPGVDLELLNMHLPGCRFVTMNKLETTFISVWKAKPWDNEYSGCGRLRGCGSESSWLNAELIDDTELVFDDAQFTVIGNGYVPDILDLAGGLATSSTISDSDVIHSVYTSEFGGHPAIELEGLCGTGGTEDGSGGETITGTLISTDNPVFKSAMECGTDFVDYSDGYPCESGYFTYQEEMWSDTYADLFVELGLEFQSFTELTDQQIQYTLASGIRSGLGNRLDCSCTVRSCTAFDELLSLTLEELEALSVEQLLALSVGVDEALPCITIQYLDQFGEMDWGMDQLEMQSAIVLEDIIGVNDHRLDGEIQLMI